MPAPKPARSLVRSQVGPLTGSARLLRGLTRVVAAGATGALLLSGTALAPHAVLSPTAATVQRATFVPVAGPVFGDPTAKTNQILSRLLANIAHTPAGETIHIVGYSFSLNNVATALIDAHARGVNVQVVLNGHSRQWSPAKRMLAAFGTDVTAPSFLVLTKGSARGTGGVTHQKSWTFTRVGSTPDVVMVGSTNLTGYGTGVQWSDTYVYTDRPDVYAVYDHVFEQQKLDTAVSRPFVVSDFAGGSATFFPLRHASATRDPVEARIDALPGDARTTIRVSQFAWYGPRGMWLAQALAAKRAQGAMVSVVAGESVGSNVRTVLTDAGIPIWSGMYAHGKRIHTKLMMASWSDATGSHQSVWTGSDNWADQSFGNDDDTLQIGDDPAGYRAYVGFFTHLTDPLGVGRLPMNGLTPTGAVIPKPVAKQATRVVKALSRHRVRLHGVARVSGHVGPLFSGRTVLVQRKRPAATTWSTVRTSAPLATASYDLRLPTGLTGAWEYRVAVPATSTALAGTSRTATLRVVR